ncbi:MAG: class I SAM-dependent methyltransferase [Dysgonamonadaceae bacterium]|jgi:2-polyprenyl-3-methyl-5-hydroxy-6-metoxy-1,4-benzoquinol methylase|nr:class I SAM-dependent methyltransferase [Dysgonamonadaceae bacterium]
MKQFKEIELFQRSQLSIWTDEYIAKNMLNAHLDKLSDGASRNELVIEKTIDWINSQIHASSNIIDLGCGPGIYASKLAKLGHTVLGIDFNIESIKYAKQHNEIENRTSYRYANYLEDSFEGTYSVAMMIYCDFSALLPNEQKIILSKIRNGLADDGLFIFDVFEKEILDKNPKKRTWSMSEGNDFWCKDPYFLLEEVKHFNDFNRIAYRHFVINQQSRDIKEYITWDGYYNSESIGNLLKENGFKIKTIKKNLIDNTNFKSNDIMFVVAEKMNNYDN